MSSQNNINSAHQTRQRSISWALRLHLGAVNLQRARSDVFAKLPDELLNTIPVQRLESLATIADNVHKEMIEELRKLSELSVAYTAANPTIGTSRNPHGYKRRHTDGDKK